MMVAVTKRGPAYQSYLLRLWPASDESQTVWRASLDSSRTGERTGFASLGELFDFLLQQTGVSPTAKTDPGETRDNFMITP